MSDETLPSVADETFAAPPVRDVPQDEYIDTATLQVKPFGGDVDPRPDVVRRARWVQGGVLAMMAILVGFGAKNALVPPPTLSVADVQSVVAESASDFPFVRGGAVALDAVSSFLTVTKESTVVGVPDGNEMRTVTGTATLTPVVSPIIYSVNEFSPSTTSYVIRADLGTVEQPKVVYLSCDVFWDKKTDRMSVATVPSFVPPPRSVSSLPLAAPLGSGVQDAALSAEVTPIVREYVRAYAGVEGADFATTTIANPPAELLHAVRGLDLASGVESAVRVTAYAGNRPNEAKADVRVSWQGAAGVQFVSTYVATLERQSSGKYLISAFRPYHFVEAE